MKIKTPDLPIPYTLRPTPCILHRAFWGKELMKVHVETSLRSAKTPGSKSHNNFLAQRNNECICKYRKLKQIRVKMFLASSGVGFMPQ